MTDLLNTEAEAQTDGLAGSGSTSPSADVRRDPQVRTFRAATLDDAVAAARTEFGQEVELREAHRVRRGGLGGFFATDLGVEIVAAPAGPAPATTTGITDAAAAAPTAFPAPSTKRIDDESLSAIERLIGNAESADRADDVLATVAADEPRLHDTTGITHELTDADGPYDYALDEPAAEEPHPFASAIESELAAATGIVADAADARAAASMLADQTTDEMSIELPSEPILPTPPTISEPAAPIAGTDPLATGFITPIGPEAPARDDEDIEDDEFAPRLPDALTADSITHPESRKTSEAPESQTSSSTVPRPLMPVLKTSAPQVPAPTQMQSAGEFTADEMLASIFSLGGRGEKSFSRISFNVTTDDGTTMSVAADFNGDESE